MHVVVNNMKGFTYIETILYMAIFVLMMTTIIPFAWNVIGAGSKSAVQQEVTGNARLISLLMLRIIRNAIGINSIATGSASFATSNPATNPTIFDLTNGYIRMTQGTGSAVLLNSNDTSASALLFTNYSTVNLSTRHVGFIFTLNGRYGSARQEYTESITVESSAEMR